jgi:hypothetical protein
MSTGQPQQQGQNTQATQPAQQQQQQRQPQQKQYPQKQYQPQRQYYGKKYRRGYQRRNYSDYQGDRSHARIVVSRDVYHKLVQYVLRYYGTLKGMSKITSELLDKAIDEAIADMENRKRYADEMHLHSEV